MNEIAGVVFLGRSVVLKGQKIVSITHFTSSLVTHIMPNLLRLGRYNIVAKHHKANVDIGGLT